MRIIIIITIALVTFGCSMTSSVDPSDQAAHVVQSLTELKINRFSVTKVEYLKDQNGVDIDKVTLKGRHITFVCSGQRDIPEELLEYESLFIQQVQEGMKNFQLVYSPNGPGGIACEVNTGDLDKESIVYTKLVPAL